jgi:hypothetical protein
MLVGKRFDCKVQVLRLRLLQLEVARPRGYLQHDARRLGNRKTSTPQFNTSERGNGDRGSEPELFLR